MAEPGPENAPIQANDCQDVKVIMNELKTTFEKVDKAHRKYPRNPKTWKDRQQKRRLKTCQEELQTWIEDCREHEQMGGMFNPPWLGTWKQSLTRSRINIPNDRTKYDKAILDPRRHHNRKDIKHARVLVLAVKRFYSASGTTVRDRRYNDDYSAIRRGFIDTFNYEDVLERIMINMIYLEKNDFNEITDEGIEDIKRDHKLGVDASPIEHLNMFKAQYKHLTDKLAGKDFKTNFEKACRVESQIQTKQVLEPLENTYWSSSEMLLLLEIMIEDPQNKETDALIVMVCSHGGLNENNETVILDCEKKPLEVKKIIEMFWSESVQGQDLCGLLFFQACRGKKDHDHESNQAEIKISKTNTLGKSDHDTCKEQEKVTETERDEPVTGNVSLAASKAVIEGRHIPLPSSSGRPPQEEAYGGAIDSISRGVNSLQVSKTTTTQLTNLRTRDNPQDDAKVHQGEGLATPNLPGSIPKSQCEPREQVLQPFQPLSTEGVCPNNCLVAYATTYGFKAGGYKDHGSIFIETFVQRIMECEEFALLPFLTLLHNELANTNKKMEMPTFDHCLLQMPIFTKPEKNN